MHTLPPAATWNARCGPGAAQRAHSVSAGAHPAIPMARNRYASSTSSRGRVPSATARNAADGQPVQRGRRGAFLTGQPLGGLQHRAPTGVAAVVADDVGGERVDGLHLGDDVEIAAGVQLNVDVRERLQPGPELAAGAAHALGHRADQPVLAGEQGHDPVGLAELVLAQHDRSIPVQPHPHSLPPCRLTATA